MKLFPGFQLDYLVQTVGCLVMLLIGASLFDIPKPLTLLLALGIIADAPIQYRQNVIPLLGAALFRMISSPHSMLVYLLHDSH